MNKDNLQAAGVALYGKSWQSELAANLGVSRMMVIHWLKGTYPIAQERQEQIAGLIDAKIKQLASVKSTIKTNA